MSVIELPKKVRQRAVRPPGLPEGECAWSQTDALDVLKTFEGSLVALFRVDIYVVPLGQHEVIPTGRRATYSYNPGELAIEFAQRSRHEAEEFIGAGSDDELYVLSLSGQDDAEAGHGTVRLRAG